MQHGSIGPYVITGELARGGMGIVYKARDRRANRDVALKLLQASSPTQKARFQREVDSLMRLRHRYVVSAHDAGEFRGHPFLVLDLVEGESLQTRIDRGGVLEPDDAVEIVRKLAQAVAYANVQGVLHRDIKPANVLIDEQGEPRLTDFGLAKLADGDTHRLSQTGMSHGTPGFWAPEQAIGDLKRIGPPTDVYGLGATLYAALTGRPPVDGVSFMELLVATRERRPERPGVDKHLDEIVLRCLEKDPAERYASAAELELELAGWTASGSGPGLAVWLVAGGSALVSLLVLVLVFWLGRAGEPPESEPEPPSVGEVAEARPVVVEVGPIDSEIALAAAKALDRDALTRAAEETEPEEPQTAKEWVDRGLVFERTKDHDRAVQAYTRAIELKPGYAQAFNNRGWNREQLGDLAGAVADYDAALMASPKYTQAWINRGLTRMTEERYEEAIADFDQAVASDPEAKKKADAIANRGQAKLAMGNHEEALVEFEAALKIDPDNQIALGGRSLVRQGTGDVERGMEDLGRSLMEGAKDGYSAPTRAVGDERLAHDMAAVFGAKRFQLKVQQSNPSAMRVVFATLSKEKASEAARCLRDVWIVLGYSREMEGRLNNAGLYRCVSEDAARRLVGFMRVLNEARESQLESMAEIDRVTTSWGEGSGVEGVPGFTVERRITGSGETLVAQGALFQTGPYCVEVASTTDQTPAQMQAMVAQLVELVRTAIRKKE